MAELTLLLTIGVLLVFLYVREQQNRDERKDLLDRIMSRTFVEYKENTTAPVKYDPVSVSDAEEYRREIEEHRMM